MIDLNMIKISQHAKERYAERIMDKDGAYDINSFIVNNEEKIKRDISKMIEFGEFIFYGKPTSDIFSRQPVEIYLKDTWVVIVDPKKCTVVTLYAIDLGLGVDFNREYVKKLLEKIANAKVHMETAKASIQEQAETYKDLIHQNDAVIVENRKLIKSLEEQNKGYYDVINSLQANVSVAEKDVRDVVAVLIGKKVF